jgi:hypothetical protein
MISKPFKQYEWLSLSITKKAKCECFYVQFKLKKVTIQFFDYNYFSLTDPLCRIRQGFADCKEFSGLYFFRSYIALIPSS